MFYVIKNSKLYKLFSFIIMVILVATMFSYITPVPTGPHNGEQNPYFLDIIYLESERCCQLQLLPTAEVFQTMNITNCFLSLFIQFEYVFGFETMGFVKRHNAIIAIEFMIHDAQVINNNNKCNTSMHNQSSI